MIGKKEENAMLSKKFSKLAVLSLLGAFALTGCDSSSSSEIKAWPKNYNDEIITIDGYDEDIHNNILKIIYDAMRDGQVASKTLEQVLYRYAQTIFGSYNKVTLADNEQGSITLKAAAADVKQNGNFEIADQFIRAHKSFWTYNDEGEHVDDEGKVVENDKTFTPSSSERTRVLSKFQVIEERIAENMFTKISSGSYTNKHFFDESKYLKSLYEDGQDVARYIDVKDQITPMIIDYTVEGKDVFEEGILHREYYQSHYEFNEDETLVGHHYVEKEILPAVYNDLLVEQYLLDEEAVAVRNSYARQINVIKIEKYSDFKINADLLVKELVKEIYATVPEASASSLSYVDEDHNAFDAIFEKYQNISKGLYDEIKDDDAALEIISNIHASRSDAFDLKTGEKSGKKYYANTTYGDLVEEYEELLSATNYEEIDQDLLNKYTSNGTISLAEGFDQAVIDIDQSKAITKGWYVKKSAPSLDSNGEITKKLFQISIANAKVEIKDQNDTESLAKLYETDRIQKIGGVWQPREAAADAENKFLCSINGAFFLKFEGSYSGSDYKEDIVYDDGSAYYIVQVLEAVKDVKLRNGLSANSYAHTRGQEFLNKVTAEVTKKVAETGNYSSLAKEYWLEKMSIKYHDQAVYDYFKSNYPDLFD